MTSRSAKLLRVDLNVHLDQFSSMVDSHNFIGKIIEILSDFGQNYESAKIIIFKIEAH